MKADGSHEGCIEQINRLFDSRLYGFPCGKALDVAKELGCKLNDKNISVDEENRIRIDDRELSKAVQEKFQAGNSCIYNKHYCFIGFDSSLYILCIYIEKFLRRSLDAPCFDYICIFYYDADVHLSAYGGI